METGLWGLAFISVIIAPAPGYHPGHADGLQEGESQAGHPEKVFDGLFGPVCILFI